MEQAAGVRRWLVWRWQVYPNTCRMYRLWIQTPWPKAVGPLDNENLPMRAVRIFVIALAATALGLTAAFSRNLRPLDGPGWLAVVVFGALGVASVWHEVSSADGHVGYSWGYAVQLACAITLPPVVAALTVVAASATRMLRLGRQHWRWPGRQLIGHIFNTAAGVISIVLAGQLFALLSGLAEQHHVPGLLALLATALAFVPLQILPVSLVIALDQRIPPWRTPVLLLDGALSDTALSLVGGAVGWFFRIDPFSLLLTVPPVLIIHTWLGKLQRMYKNIRALNEKLEQANHGLIETLATVIDARDSSTYRHSYHVARYSAAIGEEMGLLPEQVDELRQGALVHDIGKVGIPEAILFKPGRLDDQEYAQIKNHTHIGYRIVGQVSGLAHLAQIVWLHHERWQGGGYPLGIVGEAIPLTARIVSVADTLDVILSDRPYRRADSLETALREIRRCSGSQFDPQVVTALERVVRRRGETWFTNSGAVAATSMTPPPGLTTDSGPGR